MNKPITYQNPVWDGYFADPFVLKTEGGTYYAYGTGAADAKGETPGNCFPILTSTDLAHWQPLGGALPPRADLPLNSHYWAPAVVENNGQFLLYYSAAPRTADGEHRLRVAVSDSPGGPFADPGYDLLPDEGFSIDADPFRDPQTGNWYLFFAKDFLDGERVGTGLAVAPLSPDGLHVCGPVQTVLRAESDAQIYQTNRVHYGQTWDKWHTVEGPSVLFHQGRYWCFWSGGNWQTDNYAVGCASSDTPLGPWKAESTTVLRGDIAKGVIGPGHNSFTVAPDGTHLMVYHAWDAARVARRLCIDPLVWTQNGPVCDGPSVDKRVL